MSDELQQIMERHKNRRGVCMFDAQFWPCDAEQLRARLAETEVSEDKWRTSARYLHDKLAKREAQWTAVLREHYLSAITCDHKLKIDQAVCACSQVNLGWHHNVGAAVESWILHVLDQARAARQAGPGEIVCGCGHNYPAHTWEDGRCGGLTPARSLCPCRKFLDARRQPEGGGADVCSYAGPYCTGMARCPTEGGGAGQAEG